MSETSLTGPTLAEIKTSIDNQKVINDLIDTFFTTTTSKDVSIAYSEIIKKLIEIAEVKKAIDEQKLTSEIINKFFEGSKPQDITTTLSYMDRHIKDQVRLEINNLLASFFFNWEAGRIMTDNEIGANYLDIYNDILGLKEKVKIPHNQIIIKNIVHTVKHGTMDWIRDVYTTFSIGFLEVAKWIHGIYRLTWISGDQFNMIADGKTYSGGTATFISNGRDFSFNFVAVNSSTVRSKIIWCLELVDDFSG